MPAFVSIVTIDLDELFKNSAVTTSTFGRESCGIMKVTINISFVFVIRILLAKKCWADRASEMLDMELFICTRMGSEKRETKFTGIHTACSNVASSQSLTALSTNQVQSAEIIALAKRLYGQVCCSLPRLSWAQFWCLAVSSNTTRPTCAFLYRASTSQTPCCFLPHSA